MLNSRNRNIFFFFLVFLFVCLFFDNYVQFLEKVIKQGRRITLSEVCNLIKEKDIIETFTNKIKFLRKKDLEKEFIFFS